MRDYLGEIIFLFARNKTENYLPIFFPIRAAGVDRRERKKI
jgi:hypothetical protein